MPSNFLNKNQRRTYETREKLLEAAEEVFVRDGYEGAQLAVIALTAGRSKGALYGHFKSKEDLFLALFEHRSNQNKDRFLRSIEGLTSRRQRMEAFRDFYAELVHDKAWPILSLEFKLFALRHAQAKEYLMKAMKRAVPLDDEELFIRIHGRPNRQQKPDIELSVLALAPILSALMLESNFEPERMSDKALKRLLIKMFGALFTMPN